MNCKSDVLPVAPRHHPTDTVTLANDHDDGGGGGGSDVAGDNGNDVDVLHCARSCND